MCLPKIIKTDQGLAKLIGVARILSGVHFFLTEVDDLF